MTQDLRMEFHNPKKYLFILLYTINYVFFKIWKVVKQVNA